ncbi:MAG: sterol desaturase family protein [Bdellovibrionales bacterium]|mgnify:CR=1 FL=1|jgi:sterol desaturase/sphingolipid hydroxylase (fatty acid hydroxylase superfamily)|nr:sterol desaturase family protein [Bdellovibrionales bacterium]MBT3526352.1 sterol desaturase family protein [Bdellovibrionales bacterium]MBT7668556.1 sterol desaturase family protein [Bdellovibrionales bacterium]MBT7766035.1 sterol desaturase family protein [Bdellovibrionales bacterium]
MSNNLDNTDIRLILFGGILVVMILWELIAPKRIPTYGRLVRWYSNLGITAINTLLTRIIFSTSTVAFAWNIQQSGLGVFNQIGLPTLLETILSIILLDLIIYLQHLIFHLAPWLWRLHQMHHTDLDYDVTTALRFHPLEIIISMAIKLSAILLLGISPSAILIFIIILNGMAMFTHGNIKLPDSIDRLLRKLLVTPDMHRIHHSADKYEMNKNFGFNLSIWDKLFSTYLVASRNENQPLDIGCTVFRNQKYLHLHWLLLQPFMRSGEDSRKDGNAN